MVSSNEISYLCIIIYMHVISANETEVTTKGLGFSEVSICQNSTTDCFSEQTTDPIPPNISDGFTEQSVVSDIVTETTASVSAPSTVPSPLHGERKQGDINLIGKPCHCDTMVGVCNINCCCDLDCSKWERDAFSKCTASNLIPTVGYCISTGIIYKNNTPYPVVKSEDGFFCISKDNFPERNWFLEQGIIKSDRMFERVWHRKRHYLWKIHHPPKFIELIKKDLYKYGDPVWMYLNSSNTVQQLAYPSSLTSSMCGQNQIILYLQNFESNCLENIPLTKEHCLKYSFSTVNNYFGQVLIASPSLINNTYNLEESPDEAFIIVKYKICRESECNEVSSYPIPDFNSTTHNCKNLVKSVDLEIIHNGSRGIIEARCRIDLGSTRPQQPLFHRSFKVQFLSALQSNTSVIFKRSGTPGYKVGLPVITGFLQGSQVVKKNYLTVVGGPNCSESIKVLFGINSRTHCILQVPIDSTRNCTHLQEEVAKLLLFQRTGDMIGASGDPDTWLKRPIPVPEHFRPLTAQKSCSVATSLSLDFLYSYSGSLWLPKANIIGVSSALAGHRFIDCSTSMFVCSLRLVSVVSFTDISQPAVSKFATPPVVKIKLPQDFFYPFSSSASSILMKKKTVAYLIYFYLLYIISRNEEYYVVCF